ncbi:MAG: acyl-CoA dehydrogenase family protein [Alphaproteobacteria bacterium]
MDPIHLRDEHRLLQRQVRRFVEDEVLSHAPQWEKDGMVPRAVLRRMGELGFLGVRIPEAYGGSGMDALASAVFAEELARCTYTGFTMTVLADTEMAAPHLIRAGTDGQKRRYLAPIAKGEIVAAIAVTEPDAGSDVQGIRMNARREGNGWVLNGTKRFITNGVHGDLYVVAAKTDPKAKASRGMSMFLVERKTPGVTVAKKLDKMGWLCSDTAEIVFDEARLPADALLGEENKGFYAVMQSFQNERLVAAAIYAGEAAKAIEIALDYVKTRKAFGGTLWDKQAVRLRLADYAARVEMLRQLVYHAAWLDTQGIDCVREVSMAKSIGGELVHEVVHGCLQLHGGMGFMRETTIERMARDGRVHTFGGGATEVMLEEVAKRLAM